VFLRGEKTLQSLTFLGFVGETSEKQKPPKKKYLHVIYPGTLIKDNSYLRDNKPNLLESPN